MKEQKLQEYLQTTFATRLKRKSFLKYSALSGTALVLGLDACKKHNNNPSPMGSTTDVGGGDTGILNFAYALEQLEAAFYIKVNASFYSGITDDEKQILTDIMNNETAHRDFFKAALGACAITQMTFDVYSVHFGDRNAVLPTAKALEDTGVAAYN